MLCKKVRVFEQYFKNKRNNNYLRKERKKVNWKKQIMKLIEMQKRGWRS